MASTRKPRNLNKRFGKFNEEIQDKGGASLNKKTRKRKLADMLGSQWSKDELDRFYEAYRKHGKDWKQIAGAVRNRSVGMVEALYNMNKAYLSLPEGHATAAGLIAMMTDHYNMLEGSDSEHESNDALRTSRKAPKRGRGKFKLMSKASDGPFPDLLQSHGSTSSYGFLSLLKRKRSGGSKPRVVGKRTPRIPVPHFLKEDRNKMLSPSKQSLRAESLTVDDDGVHVAAMALAEASQRGGSPQISRTPSRRRGHVTHSPVPSSERKDLELQTRESKIRNCQLDDDHLEGSLGSREAENGEFFNNACISGKQHKSRKFQGKGSKVVEDVPLDDDREACSGTEEGTNVRKTKDESTSDFTGGIALQTPKGSKKRSQQLFFGDGSSALDALQTLADLSLLLPASTTESELSMHVKEERGAEVMDEKPSLPGSLSPNLEREVFNTSKRKDKGHSAAVDGVVRKSAKPSRVFAYDTNTSENKQKIGSSNSKIKKRKTKHMIEKISKSSFEVDLQKSEHHNAENVPEDVKRSTGKVKRVCQVSVPKHGKSSKLQEGHATASDSERVMTDATEAVVACFDGNDAILTTKVRNRRKGNLQKTLSGLQVKSSESATEEHPERYLFCKRPYDLKEKLSHGLSSCLLRRWCKFEWFYSAIDYPWFAKSEFVEYLDHVRLGHIPRLTRVEWGVIRSSLGKPRRLSYQFLKQEREKLEQYRESVRSHYSDLRAGAGDGLPTDLSRPLSVGQRVIACHPRSREVHDGSVLTVDRNRCRVQFDRPELGVEFVTDVDCMPVNLLDDVPEPLRREKIAINKFSAGFSNLRLDEQKEIKLRENMKFALADSLDVAEATSHVDSYSYPMNTLMIQAKGDTLDAILQAKAAVNEVTVAAQQAMYNQPFTLAQIQAREADIRALADLSRALDKKEALIMELRQMNEEVSGMQKSGEHIKDLESFRKQYAMVLLQLRDVNNQVASALLYLRTRNTYERSSALPWPKANETPELLGSLNSSTLLTHDSGSNIVEVIQSSRQKAKAMVDVAVQAMCSLKGGEDAFSKIGEALELACSRNPGSGSSVAAVRNGFADQSHDNEDHISSKFEPDTAQTTSPNFFPTSANEIQYPSELISSCVATLFMIQICSERQYPPAEVAQILDSAVASLQPCCPQNLPIFREIETCMGIIKNQMLALVPTQSSSLASDTPIL